MGKHSNYFLAKCFSNYLGCAIVKDRMTVGVAGNIIDSVLKFGTDGWRLKLRRLKNITPDHARRILEIRTGEELEGVEVCIDTSNPLSVSIGINTPGMAIRFIAIQYQDAALTDAERQYLIGEGYDVGFSYVSSLIYDNIAVDADTLQDHDKFWNKSRVERNFRDELLANLNYCSMLSKAAGSPHHIGIINALIGAEQIGKTRELFMAMGPAITKLREDSDRGHQAANN